MRDALSAAVYPTFLHDFRGFQHSLIGIRLLVVVLYIPYRTLTLWVALVSKDSTVSLGVGNTNATKPYLGCFDVCAVKTI